MLSGYWTDGAGCTIETLAELMGDTPKVAFDHYGKEWGQHYQEPLWAAIGEGADSLAKQIKHIAKAKKKAVAVAEPRRRINDLQKRKSASHPPGHPR
jgi:hypothetical protein